MRQRANPPLSSLICAAVLQARRNNSPRLSAEMRRFISGFVSLWHCSQLTKYVEDIGTSGGQSVVYDWDIQSNCNGKCIEISNHLTANAVVISPAHYVSAELHWVWNTTLLTIMNVCMSWVGSVHRFHTVVCTRCLFMWTFHTDNVMTIIAYRNIIILSTSMPSAYCL